MKITGIYKITSPSNKIYIGQSIDILSRCMSYKNYSCKNQILLYNSLKKHGFDKHKFEVLCQCDEEQLNKLEKYYVDLFQSFNTSHGLNIRDGGGSNGRHSEETKRKISESLKGHPVSDECRNGMRLRNKGKKLSVESVKKREETRKKNGYKPSEETKKKMSLARIGHIPSEESRRKMSESRKGVPTGRKGMKHTEESKRKMSEARKRYLNGK